MLLHLLSTGSAPEATVLDGWEFRGWYAQWSLPAIIARKHRKGFYRLGGGRGLGGYMIPCHDGTPSEPWIDRLRGAASWRTGWFTLVQDEGARHVTLDWSRGGRAGVLDPLGFVRERLVQPFEGCPDILVASTEFRAGTQVRLLGVSVLERHAPGPMGL